MRGLQFEYRTGELRKSYEFAHSLPISSSALPVQKLAQNAPIRNTLKRFFFSSL
jgi:hypothetical protein